MPNTENITGKKHSRGKPFTRETAREARQIRTAKEKANASIVEEFKKLVNEFQTDKNGKQILGAKIIARSIMNGCINGNAKCIDQALAIMGEKPAENINISAIDFSALDAVSWDDDKA